MMKFKSKYGFLADLNLDNSVQAKLSLYLDSVVRGNDLVLTTPLGKAVDPNIILKEFDLLFNSKTNLNLLNKALIDLEMANRSKYGPRSIAAPWLERLDSINEYFASEVKCQALKFAPQFSKFCNTLRPISKDKALKLLKNSTNSGLPKFAPKGSVKEWLSVHFEEDLETGWPCIIFTRTQEGGKTRNVWGYAMSMTLFEMMFYRPLLEFQRKQSWRAALIGPDEVDTRVTELVNSAILRDVSLLSIDFSRYDASVKRSLQRYAFDYIKCLFQKEYSDDIDFIFERFNNVGLLTPDGIIKGSHGVPSGSTFTNEVDSIVQYLLATNSSYIFAENMQVQGDDGVYSVKSSNIDSVYSTFTKNGLNVNIEKSHISKNRCYYLQKLHDSDYRLDNGMIGGIYPVYRALCRLVYQERWTDFEDYGIKGSDYYSIRAICILENCKYHPLHSVLVKFVYDLDKYSLKFSQDGLNKYVSMLKETSGSEDIIINQYGDDIKGIKSFKTSKLLVEMA